MSLNNMIVYKNYITTTRSEIANDLVERFNAASRGTIILRPGTAIKGDFEKEAFFKEMGNLVRRRNPYGDEDIPTINFEMDEYESVKVASGTPMAEWTREQFNWIGMDQAEAGIQIGRNLAKQVVLERFTLALSILIACLSKEGATLTHDITAEATAAERKPSLGHLQTAARKFGDAHGRISCWIMHSSVAFDVYKEALENTSQLFKYGEVQVREDSLGNVFVITDAEGLVDNVSNPGTPRYRTLGLTQGSAAVEDNNDFFQNLLSVNGKENIKYTWQAEWSNQFKMKGYYWNSATGGKAPTDAALLSSENWIKYKTSHKDLPGVMLVSE